MATNVFFKRIADLTPAQAIKIWKLAHAAEILETEPPTEATGAMLRDEIGDTERMNKLMRMLGKTPGQEGVVQALYGRAPAKINSKTANLPTKAPKAAAPEGAKRGRPATGNNSGRYSNEALNPAHYVIVKCKNPKRPSSESYARFEKYKSGLTVQQTLAIENGPTRGDLQWDRLRHHIEIVAELPEELMAKSSKQKTTVSSKGVTLPAVGGKDKEPEAPAATA